MARKIGMVGYTPPALWFGGGGCYVTDSHNGKSYGIYDDVFGAHRLGMDRGEVLSLLIDRQVSFEVGQKEGLYSTAIEVAIEVRLEEKPFIAVLRPLLKVSALFVGWEYLGYLLYLVMLQLFGILGVLMILGLPIPIYIWVVSKFVGEYFPLKKMYDLHHRDILPPA